MIKDPLSVKVGAVIFLIGVTTMVVVIIGGAFRTNFWLGILATGFLLSGLGMVLVTVMDYEEASEAVWRQRVEELERERNLHMGNARVFERDLREVRAEVERLKSGDAWQLLSRQLENALAQRDEARATKDMHKERQEEAWAEVARLTITLATLVLALDDPYNLSVQHALDAARKVLAPEVKP